LPHARRTDEGSAPSTSILTSPIVSIAEAGFQVVETKAGWMRAFKISVGAQIGDHARRRCLVAAPTAE